jgi:MFS family permease
MVWSINNFKCSICSCRSGSNSEHFKVPECSFSSKFFGQVEIMISILKPFIALYAAMLLVAMSLGLLTTFLSLKLNFEGFSTQVTGVILTCYFIGTIVGNFYCSRIIRKVGHIRAFTAFAALATTMIMLHGCYISAFAWAVFRFVSGVAAIGLYMVIESWLNECAHPRARGRVFSIYMVVNYLGVGIGQQFLNFGETKDDTLFFVIGFLLVSCIIPVALTTHSISPKMARFEPVRLKTIIQKAPLGMIGCFTAGLISSSFYTIGPLFCHQINLSMSQISYFMTITILGGLTLQWPVGTFSDRFDRSLVIPAIGGLFAVTSGVMLLATRSSFGVFIAATALFGGLMFTIYPTAVARVHDMFESKNVVNVSSAILFFYGIGAAIGPIASSSTMTLLDSPHGFYIYFLVISATYALVSLILRQKEITRIIPVEEQVDYMIMKDTSKIAMQIDPRSDVDKY